MKIALCLSGQSRCVIPNYPNIKRSILDVADVDIFIHTWTSLDYVDQNSRPITNPDNVVQLYRPKKHTIEDQIIFDKHDFEHITDYVDRREWMFQRVKSMFYSIQKSNALKLQFEEENSFKYDCVVRCRMDSILPTVFSLDELSKNPDSLFIYGYEFGVPAICYGDQLAFGKSEIMDMYSQVYSWLSEGIRITGRIHPGTILTWYIDQIKQLPVDRTSIFLIGGQDKFMRE